ncbi:MAG: peroxide stress protein YaaA [Brumimicrobium sp.]
MKILLSPAKLLDYEDVVKTPFTSRPEFLKETEYLVKKLQKMSAKKLSELMKISNDLGEINYDRYKKWKTPSQIGKDIQPAITVFNGEVYKGLDVATFSDEDFKNAQENLRILSGLYGILKPLDLMYPYRLEMGTKWGISPKTKSLYGFWGTKLAESLQNEMKKDEVVVNLASTEYFKVIGSKNIKNRIITPVFKDLRADKLKVIMVFAKHARGAMTRFIIQNKIENPEHLKAYDIDGYMFSEKHSSENEWVFIR